MSMPSWLSAYADKVIEASWLTALILAPLFFNPYDSRVFELSKVALVRTLALVMFAAWLIRCSELYSLRVGGAGSSAGRLRPRRFLARLRALCAAWSSENPLALPTFFVIAVYSVSTLASVSPSQSVLGSYERSQGLYTTLSYILIFFLAANTLRSAAQIERAMSVVLITSFPVAFYGIIQHYGLAPPDWSSAPGSLVSTIGNPIFVGAYLVMIIPLTLGRLLGQADLIAHHTGAGPVRALLYSGIVFSFLIPAATWVLCAKFSPQHFSASGEAPMLTPQVLGVVQGNFHCALGVTLAMIAGWWGVGWWKRDTRPFLQVGLYTSLFALQVVCLVFTQKRGPFLGLLGGLWAFAVLYALIQGARRTALAVVGLGIVSLVLLALVNFWSPFRQWRPTPYVGRLVQIFDVEDPNTKVRALIWEGALHLMLPHAPLWSPTAGEDTLNLLRPLIGYGPESLHPAYHWVYSPALALLEGPTALPDRAHNETLDMLVTTGLFGVAAYLVLFSALFLFGLQRLGFICTARQRRVFMALWLGTGVATALAAGISLGWHFIGIALPGGMIMGFFLYFVGFIVLRAQWVPPSPPRAVLLVMVIAALLGHFIEVQFGIAVTATRTYFWFFVAMLVVVGVQRFPEFAVTSAAEQHGKTAGSMTPLITFALLTGLTLVTLAFDFVSTKRLVGDTGEAARAIDVVIASLTSVITSDGQQPSFAMLWLFIGTLFFALVLGLTHWRRQVAVRSDEWLFEIAISLAITFMLFFAHVFAQTLLLTRRDSNPLDGLISTFPLFVSCLIGIVLLVAGALTLESPLPRTGIVRWWSGAVIPIVAVVVAGLIIKTNVSVIQADVIYRYAPRLAGESTRETQVNLMRRALAMQLPQDYAFAFLGDAYLAYASQLAEPTQRDKVLTQAEKALRDAQVLNPLNPEHTVRLGDLHLMWADYVSSHAGKEGHLHKSLDYYAQAIRLSPNMAPFSERYTRALREYSAFLAKSQTSPSAPAPSPPEKP
jgi:hypothetical protein